MTEFADPNQKEIASQYPQMHNHYTQIFKMFSIVAYKTEDRYLEIK